MTDWLYIVHPATGGTGWIPDTPGVLAHHRGRGWEQAEPPVEEEPEPLAAARDAEPEVNGPQPTEAGALVEALNSLAGQGREDDQEEASDLPATDDDDEGRGVTTSG